MNKKYMKSMKKAAYTNFAAKITAASLATILAGASISMLGFAANSAYASESSSVTSSQTDNSAKDSNLQSDVNNTAAGFFKSAMHNSSLTQEQREDARNAYETLLGKMDRPDWYDEKVTLGKGDEYPDSITRLKNSISYMRAINEFRKSIGLEPMGVGLQETAWAINDSFYSANYTDHAHHYNCFENLAWAQYGDGTYNGGTTPDTMTDAMEQWITEEKKIYDEYKNKGLEPPHKEVGHYLNFMNGDVRSMGFTSGNISDEYGSIATWDATTYDPRFTLDEYEKLLNGYINGDFGSSNDSEDSDDTSNSENTNNSGDSATPEADNTTPSATPDISNDAVDVTYAPDADYTPEATDVIPYNTYNYDANAYTYDTNAYTYDTNAYDYGYNTNAYDLTPYVANTFDTNAYTYDTNTYDYGYDTNAYTYDTTAYDVAPYDTNAYTYDANAYDYGYDANAYTYDTNAYDYSYDANAYTYDTNAYDYGYDANAYTYDTNTYDYGYDANAYTYDATAYDYAYDANAFDTSAYNTVAEEPASTNDETASKPADASATASDETATPAATIDTLLQVVPADK